MARAVVSTLVAAACGGLVVLFLVKMLPGGKWSLLKLINGMLAGESHHPGSQFDIFYLQEWSPFVRDATSMNPGQLLLSQLFPESSMSSSPG